jgi:hypothetical protein
MPGLRIEICVAAAVDRAVPDADVRKPRRSHVGLFEEEPGGMSPALAAHGVLPGWRQHVVPSTPDGAVLIGKARQ